jgi:hypothetical protein
MATVTMAVDGTVKTIDDGTEFGTDDHSMITTDGDEAETM